VIAALVTLETEVATGVIPLRRIRELVNADRPSPEQITSRRLGALLRALGLNTRRRARGMVVDYHTDYIALLASRHGIVGGDDQ